MPYCTQADLEAAIGGAAILKQLLDKDGDGTADAAQVTAVLTEATAECDAAIQVAVQLPLSTTPDALKYNCARIAAYLAHLQGGEGQVVPDAIQRKYDMARDFLTRVARREATLGVASKPVTDHQVKQVERSTATKPRFTFETSKGFIW